MLCQRLETETASDPFEIYRALRFINPSPYMFYLELEDLRVIGSSPETMVRLTGDTIELRPIAGTRRGAPRRKKSGSLKPICLADPKERAEHIMLVDLGRNDVGRVAEIGSVEVNELMAIERYSHVIHIVSNVRGKLAADKTPFDLFVSAFLPAPSPARRRFAPCRLSANWSREARVCTRAPLATSAYNGNLDTCIVIRTIVMKGKKSLSTPERGLSPTPIPKWSIRRR